MKEVLKIDSVQKDCSGCSACFAACPINAISMKENEEGFLYPEIDSEKCTNCGLCSKICPVINPKYSNTSEPACYAAMASDEIRKDSSSGGMFPILAYNVLKNGGYVAGAVWEGKRVVHIVSNKKEDIEKMRKSKYLQSSMENCYSDIKQLLEADKEVLFTGTPCQVAGLKAYLKKDYEKLFTVEIICHGTPSPMVFRKYLEANLTGDEQFICTDFRDKVSGWNKSSVTTLTNNRKFSFNSQSDIFLKVFLKNLCLRPSCGDCKFNKMPRQADLTIGDFWRIKKFSKKLDDEKGTSVVLVNNSKGKIIFDRIKKDLKTLKSVPLEYAIKGNPNLVGSSNINPKRKKFFEMIKSNSLKDVTEDIFGSKCDYLIVNFWATYNNYGAVLTAYAMQELVKSFGFVPRLLKTGEKTKALIYKDSISDRFSSKYLDLTEDLTFKKCKNLSKTLKGVILGSDQVLRLAYMKNCLVKYLLNFVDNDCRKLAISASFGIDKQEFLSDAHYSNRLKNIMGKSLKSFDYLSCRELSGKEIYKDVFELDSDMILDPVFMVPLSKFIELADLSKKSFDNKVVSYILDDKNYYNFEERFKTDIIKLNNDNNPASVEDWLNGIKSCKFFITDSFHGACFAILFNKPFICIMNKDRGSARFDSISQITGIKANFISSLDELNGLNLLPDYVEVNSRLEAEQERCLKIIKEILVNGYSNNPNKKKYTYKHKFSLQRIKDVLNYRFCKIKQKIYKKKAIHYDEKICKLRYRIDWEP